MTSQVSPQQRLNGNNFSSQDEYWMDYAIQLANLAAQKNEVPVGAVLVHEDKLVGKGHNSPLANHDPSAHAEIIALREGANFLQNYRLVDTTLYVTLEPCLMCAGAMIHARIKRVIFGALDPRAGVIVSQDHLFDRTFFNHKVQYAGGLLAQSCGEILSAFFKQRRKVTKYA